MPQSAAVSEPSCEQKGLPRFHEAIRYRTIKVWLRLWLRVLFHVDSFLLHLLAIHWIILLLDHLHIARTCRRLRKLCRLRQSRSWLSFLHWHDAKDNLLLSISLGMRIWGLDNHQVSRRAWTRQSHTYAGNAMLHGSICKQLQAAIVLQLQLPQLVCPSQENASKYSSGLNCHKGCLKVGVG